MNKSKRRQRERVAKSARGVEMVRRVLRAESLEDRCLLAADLGVEFSAWHNQAYATDVNSDGATTPVDALVIINELNSVGPHSLAGASRLAAEGETSTSRFLDTNGDNYLSAADALRVINFLNAEGEGDPPAAPSDLVVKAVSNPTVGTPPGENFLQWKDNSDNESGFKVERQDPVSGSWTVIYSGAAPEVTTGQVQVDGSVGNNQVKLEPIAENDVQSWDIQLDYVPGLTVELVSGTGAGQSRTITQYNQSSSIATLDTAWDVVPASDTSYRITSPRFSDTGLSPGQAYEYRVIAFSDDGDSASSNNASMDPILVQYRLSLTDANNQPLAQNSLGQDQVIVGDAYRLHVEAADLHKNASECNQWSSTGGKGERCFPWGMYLDIDFNDGTAFTVVDQFSIDPNTFPPNSFFAFDPEFTTSQVGSVESDRFNSVGASGGLNAPNVNNDFVKVFHVDMIAADGAVVAYAGAPADALGEAAYPFGNSEAMLLFNEDWKVNTQLVDYGNTEVLSIVKPVDAQDDLVTIAEDAGLTNVNVLANDVLAIEGALAVESVDASSAVGTVVIAGDGLSIDYTAPADFNGTDVFTYLLTNGEGTTDTGTVTITVNAVNDAPVHVVAGPQSINEDATLTFNAANSNQLSVSDIDADPAGVQTVVSVNNGTLVLTTGGGASVTDNGSAAVTISGTTAQVNAALDGMTYTPQTDFNGSDTLTMVTSDLGNTGSGGTLGDTDIVAISVAALNDPPENTVPGNQVLLNMPGAVDNLNLTGATAISVADVDADPAGVQVTLSLDNAGTLTVVSPGNATVVNNGTGGVTVSGTTAEVNGALGDVRYSVDNDNFWDETVVLTVATSDLGNTGSGGTLVDTDTVSIYVAPPSKPYAIDDTASTTEDPGAALAVDVLANDLLGPDDASLTITEINGTPVSQNGSVTTANGGTVTNNNGTSLEYTPAADFNGDDSFTYTITSSPNAGDGPSTGNVTVSVTAVNDVPSFTAGSDVTSLEDAGAVVEPGWASGLSAGPADESSQTLSFQVVGNDRPELFAAPPVVDAVSGDLSFTASPDANGSAVITLLLQDDGGTENGGVDTSASQQFTITIGAVNDAPSFTGGADVTVLEDAGAQTNAAWATNLSKGPSDESGQALSFQVTGNSNPALFASGPAISETGVLSFTPAADANGSATVDIVLTDNGGTADGGNDTSTVYSFDINVTAVNDSPGFTVGGDQTVDEDAGAQAVNAWATAISAGPADESSQVLSFAVTDNTNPGLFASGPSVDAAGNLTYETAADANGSATVTLSLSDDGGTANAGVDTSVSQQFTITANAVNDAPSISLPTNPVLITDYDNVFSTANGNAFQVSDVDAGSGSVVLDLTVTRAGGLDVGTLTLVDASGLDTLSGNGTSALTLVGSLSAVNAALGSGVNYETDDATPTGTTNDFVLTADVSDQGASGSGGVLESQATMSGQVFDFIPSRIGGTVYIDADNDGQKTPDSPALAGVQMVLSGTDFQNAAVNETVFTDETGYYEFNNLKPTKAGTSYTVTQVQPDNLIDGQESLESPLVAAGNDTATVSIGIQGGVDSVENHFGEQGLEPWCISVLDLLSSSQGKPGILHSSSSGGSVWTALLGSAWDGYTNLNYVAAADGLSAQVSAKYNGQDVSSTVTWNSQARMSMRQDGDGGYVIRVYGTPADLGLAAVDNGSGGEGEASREQYEQDVDALLADGSWA